MTEEEWLGATGLAEALEHLRFAGAPRTKLGRRRLRLFACACCRRMWDLLEPQGRQAVEVAERHADGLATKEELAVAATEVSKGIRARRSQGTATPGALIALQWLVGPMTTVEVASRAPYFASRALTHATRLSPGTSWHDAREGEESFQCGLLRDVFGNPFRPLPARSFPADARSLALACYDGDVSLYPVLADALADLGEETAAEHLRRPGHVKGCHVLDWVSGWARSS